MLLLDHNTCKTVSSKKTNKASTKVSTKSCECAGKSDMTPSTLTSIRHTNGHRALVSFTWNSANYFSLVYTWYSHTEETGRKRRSCVHLHYRIGIKGYPAGA
uniref:Uncharacterized protein n=1 Tax=Anguilla anguilla TaxID=7936 RepID=A0A0E9X533_ANGAN